MREPLFAVVLGQADRFEAVPAERIEERCKLLKLRHAKAIAEKLNADTPRHAVHTPAEVTA